ncbi:MAG TPA: MFS transporter [Terriglobales bacterium]|nr:MFS transporter [Terriglobales bacterium]
MNRNRAGVALAILFAINLMNFLDRQILGAVGEDIRKEWALSDTALGTLGTAFTLVYALVGLPLGRMADTFNRTHILGAGVFVWSLLTAASGFCTNFTQLFAVRLGVGLGEASCAPAASSLIGDLFPPSARSKAMSIFMLGLPLGVAASFLAGGLIAKAYGWQMAFFLAAVPGILCSIAAVTLMHEPARGASEIDDVGSRVREGSPMRLVLSIPSLWPIVLSGALHNFNMYAIGAFIAPLMIRYHGVDIAVAGYYSTFIFGLSGIPGLLFGGMLADRLTARWLGGRMILSAVMFLVAAPLTYLAVGAGPANPMAFAVPMTLGVAAMYVYYSTTYSTLQDLVEPSLRGTAMATYFFAMYLLGASLGPMVMGRLSDHYTLAAAAAAGVTAASGAALEPFKGEGLRQAMYIIPVMNLLLTACMAAAARTVPRDIENVRAWMRQST